MFDYSRNNEYIQRDDLRDCWRCGAKATAEYGPHIYKEGFGLLDQSLYITLSAVGDKLVANVQDDEGFAETHFNYSVCCRNCQIKNDGYGSPEDAASDWNEDHSPTAMADHIDKIQRNP